MYRIFYLFLLLPFQAISVEVGETIIAPKTVLVKPMDVFKSSSVDTLESAQAQLKKSKKLKKFWGCVTELGDSSRDNLFAIIRVVTAGSFSYEKTGARGPIDCFRNKARKKVEKEEEYKVEVLDLTKYSQFAAIEVVEKNQEETTTSNPEEVNEETPEETTTTEEGQEVAEEQEETLLEDLDYIEVDSSQFDKLLTDFEISEEEEQTVLQEALETSLLYSNSKELLQGYPSSLSKACLLGYGAELQVLDTRKIKGQDFIYVVQKNQGSLYTNVDRLDICKKGTLLILTLGEFYSFQDVYKQKEQATEEFLTKVHEVLKSYLVNKGLSEESLTIGEVIYDNPRSGLARELELPASIVIAPEEVTTDLQEDLYEYSSMCTERGRITVLGFVQTNVLNSPYGATDQVVVRYQKAADPYDIVCLKKQDELKHAFLILPLRFVKSLKNKSFLDYSEFYKFELKSKTSILR